MQKLLFMDTETTGLNPEIHGIITISFKPVFFVDFGTYEVHETKTFFMNPTYAVIDNTALAVNHITKEQIDSFLHYNKVILDIIKYLKIYVNPYSKIKDDRYMLCGQNINFDIQFLQRLWERIAGLPYFYSFFKSSETISIEYVFTFLQLINKVKKTQDRKLFTIAEALGLVIDKDKLHQSSYDVDITVDVFLNLIKLIN